MYRLVPSSARRESGTILRTCGAVLLGATLVALTPVRAAAQETSPPPATPQEQAQKPAEEARSTGLPKALEWKFNLDATWGNFGFRNSLYTNPKPGEPSGDLGDNWFEGSIKPALTATFTTKSQWQLEGKVSVVGERTYGAAPTLVGEDASSFKPEDLAFTVRSGKALDSLGENAVEFTVGRARYQLGHGFLLYDGSSEGGTRGGYWTNARKAFRFATIGSFKPGPNTVQAFYLQKDELPEVDTQTKIFGLNYERAVGKATTLGATYMRFEANTLAPQREGLNVYNVRAYTAPFPNYQQVSFEAEYAKESNGDLLDSNAWYLQAAYEFSNVRWTPKVSYRYALFQGDDPATVKNEAWDPLLLGFYDWGTWWQGEIAGEYAFSDSNLASHEIRLHLAPTKMIGTGVIFFDFLADKPAGYGPQVTDKHLGNELDWYMDWKLNGNFTVSFIAAWADPGVAAQQAYDRTKSFQYAMAFFAYSY